ncbi:MAG: DUF4199 domain-containing protein [Bacteroidetes bacterium]|nr:DUF4199 domain-containing protein [Bacteroidota bacterium]
MKPIFKYSLLASFLVIAVKLLVYFTHTQFSAIGIYSGLLSLLLLTVPLFLAIKNRRDNELGGFITLKEVMKVGLGISVISGLIICAFTFLYYKFIDHETLEQLITRTTDFMHKENKTSYEIEIELTALKEFYSPFKQATGVLTGILISGLILSFILSTFFVRRNSANEN